MKSLEKTGKTETPVNKEHRIGVYVCHCGTNIAGSVDVKRVAKSASTFPNVVVARDYTYVCSDAGQALIKQDIKNLNLTKWWSRHVHQRSMNQPFVNALKMQG